ncbi:hypothetical protein ACFS32_10645 [Novosphingobium pokkalii]|uniref:hypothetical protein n=1 Tax=Novosphingobium pokkalii TaxID=1770194 RepID=UPI00362A95AE
MAWRQLHRRHRHGRAGEQPARPARRHAGRHADSAPADFGVFAIAAAFLTLSRTMLYTGPFEYVLKAPEADGAKVASAGLAANLVVALGWVILLCAAGLAAPFVFRGAGWRCCCSAWHRPTSWPRWPAGKRRWSCAGNRCGVITRSR